MKNLAEMIKKSIVKQSLQSLVVMVSLLVATAPQAKLNVNGTTAVASDYSSIPPILQDNLDPFVMINLSVELTQQAEAYTGAASNYCNSRSSGFEVCYIPTKEYIGYFDPNKCYVYDTSGGNTVRTQTALGPNASTSPTPNPHYFKPSSPVLSANHNCSGKWSGNFLNWATMTAIDEFRSAMVGGDRLVDDKDKTLLIRAHRYGDWSFVDKKISSSPSSGDISAGAVSVNPSSVTPFGGSSLTIDNDYGNNGPRFQITTSSSVTTEFNAIVQVCDPAVSLESNCTAYVDPADSTKTNYKPEGSMQKNALNMRFALTSYTGQDSNTINGGILRANAKYLGYERPKLTGGIELNPNAEIDQTGRFIYDPDTLAGSSGGVINSGVINYINLFGLGPRQYKSFDPVGELFYEGLRYFKGLGPTPEYSSAIANNDEKDNFPVITSWDDPVIGQCQPLNMLAIGDQFAWNDDDLPGTSVGSPPSNPDTDINVDTLTNTVGTNQGFHAGSLGSQTRGRQNNGWYVAGLSYYANTQDIRTNSQGRIDIPGKQTVKTYFVDTQEFKTSAPQRENNPLWLAAKYGGFDDLDGDGKPHADGIEISNAEWDADGDTVPDTYVLASEPANLVAGLNAIFNNINERISSGAAAAVVANSSNGTGAVYGAVYEPRFVNGQNQVSWVGQLRATFIDNESRLREDLDGDDILSNADPVYETAFDPVKNETTYQRFDPVTGSPIGAPRPITSLKPIWNARDELAALSSSNLVSQRVYNATGGRYIRTWVDGNNNGVVDAGEEIDFTAANFNTPSTPTSVTNGRYLGVESTTGVNAAENIANFTRGIEITGFRSRTIDFDGTGAKVWRLGDMIFSSPAAVGRPTQFYELDQNDRTYSKFKSKYANRRQVVYVGANDGMLHAFNGGFYNQSSKGFDLQGSNNETAHPLGAELWAYVPMNLLPHLSWLTQTDYPHIYYVDGEPKSYDVNIFTPDATHPDGWGTILVVGMRFGGGEISVDLNSDSDGNPSDNKIFRSAYIVFDITDPEQPPKLLAEISDDELGYTTSMPTIVKKRIPAASGSFVNPSANEWYLLFGSGPAGTNPTTKVQALQEGISSQNAKLYAFNLKTLNLEDLSSSPADKDLDLTADTMSFVGGLTAADWDNNYIDDAVYFGTQSGTVAAPSGNLKRLTLPSSFSFNSSLASATTNLLSGANQPFAATPTTLLQSGGKRWVFAGTGRLWTDGDNLSAVQQSYYGVIDSGSATPIAKSSIVDTSNIQVLSSNLVQTILPLGGSVNISGNPINTFNDLVGQVASQQGWYTDLQTTRARNYTRSELVGPSLVFSEYIPTGDICEPEGSGFLNAIDFKTGTPSPFGALGFNGNVAIKHVPLGKGVPAAPVLHVSTPNSGGPQFKILVGSSNLNNTITGIGLPPKKSDRLSWRIIR